MLTRISLIIAIVAGLAVGVLNFVKIKEKIITLQTNLKTESAANLEFEGKSNATKKELAKTQDDLKQTKDTLAATITERDKAVALADEKTKAAADLTDKLNKTQKDLNDTKADLAAYKDSGLTSQQVAAAAKTMKKLEDTIEVNKQENKVLAQKLKKTEVELAKYKEPDYHVPLPPSLLGKVLVTDPKWDFVVLNVGEDQGVLKDGEFLVNRDGKLVAKIKVSSVDKSRSIANVEPGWKLGEVLEGDQVIPAYPAS